MQILTTRENYSYGQKMSIERDSFSINSCIFEPFFAHNITKIYRTTDRIKQVKSIDIVSLTMATYKHKKCDRDREIASI